VPRPTFRNIAAAGALALIAAGPLAACGDRTVSPLPVQAAEPAATASALPSAASPAGSSAPGVAEPAVRPTKTKTGRPTSTNPTDTCFGAVRHDLDLQNEVLELVGPMCFHTGGVLRLQGTGPGLVTATPARLVTPRYEAGVEDLHFIRPGTVTVTIPQDKRTYTITVVVIS
jgi:hypothetical protein